MPPLLFHLSGAATSSSVEPTCTSRSRGDYNVLWVLTSPSSELHLPRKLRCHFSNFTKFMAQKNVNPCIQLKTIGKDFTCSFTFTGHLPRKPQLAQQEAQLSQRGRATGLSVVCFNKYKPQAHTVFYCSFGFSFTDA